jgi:hypothetical protein
MTLHTGPNVAQSHSHEHCTRLTSECSNLRFIFWADGASKVTPLNDFVFWSDLQRPWSRPGSSGQVSTWLNRPPTRIVQDASARAETGCLFSGFWCANYDPLDQFFSCRHILGNESTMLQTSTIRRTLTVIRSFLWLVAIG